jgi:hypothetical protein
MDLNIFRPYIYQNLERFGSANDGGYILPSDLTVGHLVSLGLGHNWEFEIDCLSKHFVNDFVVFDHSVSKPYFFGRVVKSLRAFPFDFFTFVYRLKLLIKYIRAFSYNKRHVELKVVSDSSTEPGVIKVFEIFEKFVKKESKLICKIDVEGDEYLLIPDFLRFSSQIEVLVIEFHEIISKQKDFEKVVSLIEKDYSLIHSHFNNFDIITSEGLPNVVEMTFIKSHLVKLTEKRNSLPIIGLDAPNSPKLSDYEIIF